MLFDDKKQPYHLMLQKFLSCGGQDALFQAFNWALSINGQVSLDEGLENPDLPGKILALCIIQYFRNGLSIQCSWTGVYN
jgi:E3 ubiquitin-protein ligase HUWE1